MQSFTYRDPQQLKTVDEALEEVDRILLHIESVAASMTPEDLAKPDAMRWFADRVLMMKPFFERAEALTYE